MKAKDELAVIKVTDQVSRYHVEGATPVIYAKLHPSMQARFAMSCVERWSMVAGAPDGEDSSGRSKLRLSTPEELVDRAMSVSNLLFKRLIEDGLFLETQPPEEIVEAAQNKHK